MREQGLEDDKEREVVKRAETLVAKRRLTKTPTPRSAVLD